MREHTKKNHYRPHNRMPIHLRTPGAFVTAKKLKNLEQTAAEAGIRA